MAKDKNKKKLTWAEQMESQSKINIAERLLIEKLMLEHWGKKVSFNQEEEMYLAKYLAPETQKTIAILSKDFKDEYGKEWNED